MLDLETIYTNLVFTVLRHDVMPTNRIKKPSKKAQPLTHFVRIVRGILFKGNGLSGVSQEIWPIALFAVVAMFIAMKRYRQTLD